MIVDELPEVEHAKKPLNPWKTNHLVPLLHTKGIRQHHARAIRMGDWLVSMLPRNRVAHVINEVIVPLNLRLEVVYDYRTVNVKLLPYVSRGIGQSVVR